jgi:hypothetical protein
MLHKLDFSETTAPEAHPPEPVVDDAQLLPNNQPSYTQSTATTQTSMHKNSVIIAVILCLIAVSAGVGTGYGTHKLVASSEVSRVGNISGDLEQVPTGTIKEGDVFGSQDSSTFKDSVKGYLEVGGLDGEGSHKLVRPGGISQTVYMTSSVTDLDKFEGMEIEVWGETFSGQKAGWFMDVGRVQVLKVAGERPTEE